RLPLHGGVLRGRAESVRVLPAEEPDVSDQRDPGRQLGQASPPAALRDPGSRQRAAPAPPRRAARARLDRRAPCAAAWHGRRSGPARDRLRDGPLTRRSGRPAATRAAAPAGAAVQPRPAPPPCRSGCPAATRADPPVGAAVQPRPAPTPL